MDVPQDIVDRYPKPLVSTVLDDRCDQCGPAVQAYVFAEFKNDTVLSLCGHCATVGWVNLTRQAILIVDLRHMIPR